MLLSISFCKAETYTLWDISFDMSIDQVETYLQNNKGIPVVKRGTAILQSKDNPKPVIFGLPCSISYMNSFNKYFAFELSEEKQNINTLTAWYQILIPQLIEEYAMPNTFIMEMYSDGIIDWENKSSSPMYYSAQDLLTENPEDLCSIDFSECLNAWCHTTNDTDVSIIIFIENIAIRGYYYAKTGNCSLNVTFHSDSSKAQTDVKIGNYSLN